MSTDRYQEIVAFVQIARSGSFSAAGKPLYTFKKDTAPGETNGDGFLNGAWHMAKP
ncbi:putative lipoprotein with Yx(FWY)xxD motif [Nitrobacteraceae bacterium AZCC 2146]